MAKTKVTEPSKIRSSINTMMTNYRVYHMSAGERILYSLLLFLAGGFVGYIFYGGLFQVDGEATAATRVSNLVVFCLMGVVAILVFLPMLQSALKNKRDKALQDQFKSLLESLAASLAAGNTVTESFENSLSDLGAQYSADDHIMLEVTEILNGIHNGRTLEEMLDAFGARTDNEDIKNFSNVITNCFRLGSDFKVAVTTTRDIISEKNSIEDEIKTKLASNKLQLNAMCLMPVLLVAMLKLTNKSFAANLATLVGVLVTTVALGIMVGAYFWGRKIIEKGGE